MKTREFTKKVEQGVELQAMTNKELENTFAGGRFIWNPETKRIVYISSRKR